MATALRSAARRLTRGIPKLEYQRPVMNAVTGAAAQPKWTRKITQLPQTLYRMPHAAESSMAVLASELPSPPAVGDIIIGESSTWSVASFRQDPNRVLWLLEVRDVGS